MTSLLLIPLIVYKQFFHRKCHLIEIHETKNAKHFFSLSIHRRLTDDEKKMLLIFSSEEAEMHFSGIRRDLPSNVPPSPQRSTLSYFCVDRRTSLLRCFSSIVCCCVLFRWFHTTCHAKNIIFTFFISFN